MKISKNNQARKKCVEEGSISSINWEATSAGLDVQLKILQIHLHLLSRIPVRSKLEIINVGVLQ